MKKIIGQGCLLALAGLLTGGCSFLGPSREIMAFNVKPANAVTIVNGVKFEYSPFFLPVDKSQDLFISVYLNTGEERNYVVRRELSTFGVLDTIGSIAILPAFGLLYGGAWRMQQNNVMINMENVSTNVEQVTDIKKLEI